MISYSVDKFITIKKKTLICGRYVVSYAHGMGLIPRQQCRKAPASVAEKKDTFLTY